MVKSGSKSSHLLARVNFPMYGVKVLSERHILVAGGGGPAKTGIANTCEIYELIYDSVNNTCNATLITHYDTGLRAIMNLCVVNKANYCYHVLSGGMDGMCSVYDVKLVIDSKKPNLSNIRRQRTDSGSLLRRRRTSSTSSNVDKENDANAGNRLLELSRQNSKPLIESSDDVDDGVPDFRFDIKLLKTFQTDFTEDEPFQKVIKFCANTNRLVTGGADGHVRVWSYPKLEMILDIKAHDNEVDDLDVNPIGSHIVSVSRDGKGLIWDATTGETCHQLVYQLPSSKNNKVADTKYIFRGSRFGIVEGDPSNCRLFTISNPLTRTKPPQNSYLCKWNTSTYSMEKTVSADQESLSTMAVSDDGRFIGLGTLTGSVDVYISYSLQRIYHLSQAHNIFVTGVEFLKTCVETQQLTGGNDTALVSVSVDNHIVVHEIPKRATLGFLGSSTFFIVFMLIIYALMNYIGL